MPSRDTPRCITPPVDGLSRADAEAAWHTVTPSIAGTPHVRISKDGGRTYPAKHARPLPGEPPGQPCTVPVYDPGAATGRMLALDLDTSRGDVDRQAATLGQLLEHHGARYVADVSPSGGVHVYIVFSTSLPWLELRDLARATALRFSTIDSAPMSSLGGQISPPGNRHKSGGWRLLSTPLDEAKAAVERPNGPEVWDGLLTEFAAELQQTEAVISETADLPSAIKAAVELDDVGVPWVPALEQQRNGEWRYLEFLQVTSLITAGIFVCEIPGGTRARHRSRPVDLPGHRC